MREREKRKRKRQSERDGQREGWTERDTETENDIQTHRQRYRDTERDRHRLSQVLTKLRLLLSSGSKVCSSLRVLRCPRMELITHTHTHTHTDEKRNRETERDRQTERERERDRETGRNKEPQTQTFAGLDEVKALAELGVEGVQLTESVTSSKDGVEEKVSKRHLQRQTAESQYMRVKGERARERERETVRDREK
jgi:zinc finger CCCH domain-containing protein 13